MDDPLRQEHKPDVFARPGRNSTNPYTALLAEALERQGLRVHDVRLSRWNLPFSRSILLLHWPDELYRRPKSLLTLIVAYAWLVHMTMAKTLAGMRVVWVAHNAVPHGYTPEQAPLRWKWFMHLLDGVISLSEEAKGEVLAAHPSLASKQWLVTCHGHYLDQALTPPTMPRALGESTVRLAALGAVRASKRFASLAEAMKHSADDVTLTIKGDPESTELADELGAIAADCPRITLGFGRMSDEELEQETDAADMIVLPYGNILNSGVLFYALSRYRPVIAPRMGSIPGVRDKVGENWIYLFDGQFGTEVLTDGVRWLRQTARTAPPDLSDQDWDRIGAQIGEFLADLLNRHES